MCSESIHLDFKEHSRVSVVPEIENTRYNTQPAGLGWWGQSLFALARFSRGAY